MKLTPEDVDYWFNYFQFEGIHTHNDDVRRRMGAGMRMCDAVKALYAIMADPHGCRFCDSGKLRNAAKPHDEGCGYALALRATGLERSAGHSDNAVSK